MKFITGKHRKQTCLFPISLEDSIESENRVRSIIQFVNSLDLAAPPDLTEPLRTLRFFSSFSSSEADKEVSTEFCCPFSYSPSFTISNHAAY
jgi:hypothetical protein